MTNSPEKRAKPAAPAALILPGEPLTAGKAAGVPLIGPGTYWMIARRSLKSPKHAGWKRLPRAACSAVFASLTSLSVKIPAYRAFPPAQVRPSERPPFRRRNGA